MRKSLRPVALSLALLSICPLTSLAQGDATAAAAGQAALNEGRYEDAITAYETLINDYKTSLAVPEALAKVGYAAFLLNDLPKAEKNLREALAAVNLSEPVKEFAMNVLPQVLSAQAANATDIKEKNKLYEAAIKEFDAFLTAFPQSLDVEGASYGKALAQYFSEKYDDAAATLTNMLTKFANTESVADTKYLLAVTKSSQGATVLQKDPKAVAATKALFDEAHKLLDDIIGMQGVQRNMALINDAQFQKGELYFNEALLVNDPEKAKPLLEEGLKAYRAVQPLAPMVAAQEERIAEILARMVTVPKEAPRLLRLRDRERIKLAQLRNKPPQTLDAKIKVARIFNQLGQYDESRVILKFIADAGLEMTDDQRKQALYYLTMSYALQNRMDEALANYEAFQKDFAGDPMAENLPLVIGNLFLTSNPPQPEKALEFFDKSLEQYPNGDLAAAAKMARGQALLSLPEPRLEDALKAFNDAVAGNPAPEIVTGSELGKGMVYLAQQKWDDAITTYSGIAQKSAGQPAAAEAQLRIVYAQQQKGDLPAAVATLEKFLAAEKEGPTVSTARYMLGEIQAAQGENAKALETYRALARDLPESPEAPTALLQVAHLLGAGEEQEKILREYLEKYPEDQNIYFAYSSLAQNRLTAGAPMEAAKLWGEFVEKYPTNEQVAPVLLGQAQMYKGIADARGGYASLDAEAQKAWQEEMNLAISTAEKLVREKPTSREVAPALAMIMTIKRAQVAAGTEKMEGIGTYFEQLASSLSDSPEARSQVLFVLASYVQPQDPARALSLMQEGYNPQLVYNASDLDNYGLALLAQDKADEAAAVFQKIMTDNAVQEGSDPKAAPAEIQKAQAVALYGLGKVAEKKGNTAEAGEHFQKLKELYPWSPKIREADYGIAASMRASRQSEQALKLIAEIVRDPNSTFDLKARCVLLAGFVHKDKGEDDAALENFKKIVLFYPNADEPAAEGLWEAAEIYKKKGMTDAHAKAISELKSRYPNTKWATQA